MRRPAETAGPPSKWPSTAKQTRRDVIPFWSLYNGDSLRAVACCAWWDACLRSVMQVRVNCVIGNAIPLEADSCTAINVVKAKTTCKMQSSKISHVQIKRDIEA
jgi:hypothetical protein